MDVQWTEPCPYEKSSELDLKEGDTAQDAVDKARKLKLLAGCLIGKRQGLISSWPR